MNAGRGGRGWAYIGMILGGVVSTAANVAHSYVPPAGAGPDWHPHGGAVVGAVFWPAFLFVAIEIMARTAWPTGARWVLLRFGGLAPVAAVAAVVSYRHLAGLLAFYAEDWVTVHFGPLAVDGLMVMATGALIASGVRRRRRKFSWTYRPKFRRPLSRRYRWPVTRKSGRKYARHLPPGRGGRRPGCTGLSS